MSVSHGDFLVEVKLRLRITMATAGWTCMRASFFITSRAKRCRPWSRAVCPEAKRSGETMTMISVLTCSSSRGLEDFIETWAKANLNRLTFLNSNGESRGAVWGDFNQDGRLDLFVGGYEVWEQRVHPDVIFSINPMEALKSGDLRKVHSARVLLPRTSTKMKIDVYVSNYRLQPNHLWLNQVKGSSKNHESYQPRESEMEDDQLHGWVQYRSLVTRLVAAGSGRRRTCRYFCRKLQSPKGRPGSPAVSS